MNRLFQAILFEFRAFRVFKIQILISLFIMPLSYMLIILLNTGGNQQISLYLLTGFVVASLIGTYVSLLGLRVSNLMMPEVLEMYAAFPIKMRTVALSYLITYSLYVLPQIIVASIIIAVISLSSIAWGLFVFNVILTMITLSGFGVFLGFFFKNYFMAQGILPLLSWIFLFITPLYYQAKSSIFFSINPLNSCVKLLRHSIGLYEGVIIWDYVYLIGLIIILSFFVNRKLLRLYLLEKRF